MSDPLPSEWTCALVVPVLNEAANVEEFIGRVQQVSAFCSEQEVSVSSERWPGFELGSSLRRAYRFKIVFVDDGSTDGTAELIHQASASGSTEIHLIERGPKQGRGCLRGSALLEGIRVACGELGADLVIEMDGDLSHRPEEIIDHLRIHEMRPGIVAISSKYTSGSKTSRRSLGRRGVSIAGTAFMRVAIDPSVSDWTNGFRSYDLPSARLILDRSGWRPDPTFLTETLALWLSHGIPVFDVPTTYVGRGEGLSKLKWFDLVRALPVAISIGRRYRRGDYLTGW